MTIKIVKAEEKHVAAIGQLWREFILFNQNTEPVFTPRISEVSDFEENLVRRLMKSVDGLVLVAMDKEQAVGYSLSQIRRSPPDSKQESYGYVNDMAVTASYRRKGIGEKMFAEIVKWLQSKNIEHVELQTIDKNIVANSFWKKQGFKDFMRTLYREIPLKTGIKID
jgi:ribosomal protein S18 acetylase RimI-like enzyme